jgi:hypothetical protein
MGAHVAWVGKYEPGDTYAEVIPTGVLTASIMTEVFDWLTTLIDEHGLQAVLIDLSSVDRVPTPGELTMMSVLAPYPNDFLEAVVVPERFAPERRAYEIPARNRARSLAQFPHRDEAIAWLTGDQPA